MDITTYMESRDAGNLSLSVSTEKDLIKWTQKLFNPLSGVEKESEKDSLKISELKEIVTKEADLMDQMKKQYAFQVSKVKNYMALSADVAKVAGEKKKKASEEE